MPQTAAELLEEIRHLPRDEQLKIAETFLGELPEDWLEEAGNSEPGYEEWFHAGVEEVRADCREKMAGSIPRKYLKLTTLVQR